MFHPAERVCNGVVSFAKVAAEPSPQGPQLCTMQPRPSRPGPELKKVDLEQCTRIDRPEHTSRHPSVYVTAIFVFEYVKYSKLPYECYLNRNVGGNPDSSIRFPPPAFHLS